MFCTAAVCNTIVCSNTKQLTFWKSALPSVNFYYSMSGTYIQLRISIHCRTNCDYHIAINTCLTSVLVEKSKNVKQTTNLLIHHCFTICLTKLNNQPLTIRIGIQWLGYFPIISLQLPAYNLSIAGISRNALYKGLQYQFTRW